MAKKVKAKPEKKEKKKSTKVDRKKKDGKKDVKKEKSKKKQEKSGKKKEKNKTQKEKKPKQKFTDHCSKYNVKEALYIMRRIKSAENLKTFIKGDERITIIKAAENIIKKF